MSLIHHHQAFERSEKPSKIGLTFLVRKPSSDSIHFLLCSIHAQPFEGTSNEVVYYQKIFASVKAAIRSTNKPHFEVVYSHSLYLCVDLVSLPAGPHDLHLHAEIRCKIALGSDSYKLFIDMLHKAVNLMVGDLVMACLQPKELPTNSFTELQARCITPYSIFNKLESVAYVLDLPANLGITPVFNVEDLTFNRGIFEPPCLPFSASAGN